MQPNAPAGALMPTGVGEYEDGQCDEESGGVRMVMQNAVVSTLCLMTISVDTSMVTRRTPLSRRRELR